MSRIGPATPPYAPSIQAQLDRIMPPGLEPLYLFRVLARDERLFSRAFAGGLLDRGNLALREREIVILRVCANHRSEYEWGVHVTQFSEKAKLSQVQVAATVGQAPDAPCWSASERLLLRLCDELSQGTRVSEPLWAELTAHWSEPARIELLMLTSYYRMICVLTNSLQLPLETFAARFPT